MTTLPHASHAQATHLKAQACNGYTLCTFSIHLANVCFWPVFLGLRLSAAICGYLHQSASICISLIFQCTRTHTTPSQNVREQRDRSAIDHAKLDLEVELCPGFLRRILCWATEHPHGTAQTGKLSTTTSRGRQCHSLNRRANR